MVCDCVMMMMMMMMCVCTCACARVHTDGMMHQFALLHVRDDIIHVATAILSQLHICVLQKHCTSHPLMRIPTDPRVTLCCPVYSCRVELKYVSDSAFSGFSKYATLAGSVSSCRHGRTRDRVHQSKWREKRGRREQYISHTRCLSFAMSDTHHFT